MSFRDRKNLFLTYPRCGLEKQDLLTFFQEFLGTNLQNYCIGQELHKEATPEQVIDGTDKHFHVFLKINDRLKSRKTDIFDVKGYHPNI